MSGRRLPRVQVRVPASRLHHRARQARHGACYSSAGLALVASGPVFWLVAGDDAPGVASPRRPTMGGGIGVAFELRHLLSGAVIRVYPSEGPALAFVRDVVRLRGHHDAARFALTYTDEHNVVQRIEKHALGAGRLAGAGAGSHGRAWLSGPHGVVYVHEPALGERSAARKCHWGWLAAVAMASSRPSGRPAAQGGLCFCQRADRRWLGGPLRSQAGAILG